MLVSLIAFSALQQPKVVARVMTPTVGVRAVRAEGEIHLEFLFREANGEYTPVALSSEHPAAKVVAGSWPSKIDLNWKEATTHGSMLLLTGDSFRAQVVASQSEPLFEINFLATDRPSQAMMGFVLAPLGKPSLAGYTFSPSSLPFAADEQFATPVAIASGGGYGLALFPRVDLLDSERPAPGLLAIENDGRTAPGAILAYGYAPFERDQDWNPVPGDGALSIGANEGWSCDLLIAKSDQVVEQAVSHLWQRDGAERARKPLPQTVPYRYYTKPLYDDIDWWTGEVDGAPVRAPKDSRLAAVQDLAQLAWGMRWWGDYLQQAAWSRNADQIMNLVVSSRLERSMFDAEAGAWRDSKPYRHETIAAARWMARYAEAFDYAMEPKMIAAVRGVLASRPARLSPEEALLEWELDGRATGAANTTIPSKSADAIYRALTLARTGDVDRAKRALEQVFLRQALWQPVTVEGTEIFGAIVDDHFVSTDQSLFTEELLEAAILVGDQELVERAIAALRAPLALFNHQTHGVSGMELPRDLALHQSVSWFGYHGIGDFGRPAGIATGSGRTLAAIAYATHKYGSIYTSAHGWTVGIDGLETDDAGKVYRSFSRNPLGFESVFPYIHVDGRNGERRDLSDPPAIPAFRSVRLALDSAGPYIVALPGLPTTDPTQISGTFTFNNDTEARAEFFPTGLGVRLPADESLVRPVKFSAQYHGKALSLPPTYLQLGPPSPERDWPTGWRRLKKLGDVTRPSLIRDATAVVSTADTGRGTRDERLMGVIESQTFLMTGVQLSCRVASTDSYGTRIEVVDAIMNVPIATTNVTNGTAVFDLPNSRGSLLIIRLTDTTATGSIDAWDFQVVGS